MFELSHNEIYEIQTAVSFPSGNLTACIGKFGAFLWNQETKRTYFVFGPNWDWSIQWRLLYQKNKKQVSQAYSEYALEIAKYNAKRKSQRDNNRASDFAWRGAYPGSTDYYPGKFRAGCMYPETSPEWRTNS